MANRLVIGTSPNSTTIEDVQIKSGSVTLTNSMIMDELTADEAEFTIIAGDEDALFDSNLEQLFDSNNQALLTSDSFGVAIDLNNVPYGTPVEVWYSIPDMLFPVYGFLAKFYVKEAKQIGKGMWVLTAQSAMGVLINQEHNGGIYTGTTVKDVIDDIMSAATGIPYIVDDAVKDVPVSGWLPVASCRDNLQQLCFALGISITKTPSIKFKYNAPDSPTRTITEDRIYMGATKNYLSPVSSVTIYEHTFYPITAALRKTVFDSGQTSVSNQKIVFENPVIVSTLVPPVGDTSGDLVISEATPNYAIVSGSGTITAVEYTHGIKALTQVVNDSPNIASREVVYKDATLVNSLNSANCLKRVAAYYSSAFENQMDIKLKGESTGMLVSYPDPFTSEMIPGMVKSLDITLSGILKARSRITENWLPRYLGNNFSVVDEISEGTTWTPNFSGDVRIVLGASGNGGNKGEDGEDGERGNIFNVAFGKAGKSGKGGLGGAPGKVYVFDATVTAGTTYDISLGAPGTAGTQESETGGAGNPTTITINGTTYSSASGSVPDNGYADVLTGRLYSLAGDTGIDAADSGDGNAPGNNLVVPPNTFLGGAAGAIFTHFKGRCYGGGGSGAVYGKNGLAGEDGRDASYGGIAHAVPGPGADGVSPNDPTKAVPLGGGGHGGHGASGGGGGSVGQDSYDGDWRASEGGVGGKGSNGLAGGGGYMLVYH